MIAKVAVMLMKIRAIARPREIFLFICRYTGLSDALLQKYIDDSASLWEGHGEKLASAIIGSVVGTHAGPGAVALAFFAKYQVSGQVENIFSLSSYISMFLSTLLMFGIVFEFPTVIALLSALGIVTKEMLRGFRKHAVCVVLILAAIITPTGDPFTLSIVFIPLYLLYELAIKIVRSGEDDEDEDKDETTA
mgnify:CR=1 FL=1